MMQLDEVKGQAGSDLRQVLPPECVCGARPDTCLAQPAVVPTCPSCGGSLLRLAEPPSPARQERRRLQDFLSAFV